MASSKRLSNAEFLSHLTELFTSTHAANHGSVFLTQKPLFLSPDNAATAAADQTSSSDQQNQQQTNPPQILVRATNGKSTRKDGGGVQKKQTKTKTKTPDAKIKFSTLVDVAEAEDFFARYAEVCKGGMQGLRKRDRKKGKKKAKGGAKKEGGK